MVVAAVVAVVVVVAVAVAVGVAVAVAFPDSQCSELDLSWFQNLPSFLRKEGSRRRPCRR